MSKTVLRPTTSATYPDPLSNQLNSPVNAQRAATVPTLLRSEFDSYEQASDEDFAKFEMMLDDGHGGFRVGNTRVSLDSVLNAFQLGSCPEEIVRQYPTLPLKEVYTVVTHYLWNKTEMNSYLERRRDETVELRQLIEGRQPQTRLRDLLETREKTKLHHESQL